MSDRIQINKPFLGKYQEYAAGTYDVGNGPNQVSMTEAKCAIADGYGQWAPVERRQARRGRPPGRKTPAPENKATPGASAYPEPGVA